MMLVKQSDTTKPIEFLMIDSADHISGKTGLTVTVTLSKNGGAFGAAAGTVAEISAGWYKLTPTSADTGTLGGLQLHATAIGADPTDKDCLVVAFDPYDPVRYGLTALPNAAAGANGGLPTGNASGQVAVASFANNALTAAAINADALTAAKVAPDVGTEIAGAVRTDLAVELARIDVANSSRASQTSLDVVDDFLDTEVAAIKAKTDNLPASPAGVGSVMQLDLAQAVPTTNTAQTVGDALNAARAQGFGKWTISGTTLTLYAANGTTVVRTFTLDSATDPTSRT